MTAAPVGKDEFPAKRPYRSLVRGGFGVPDPAPVLQLHIGGLRETIVRRGKVDG
jgi:hypothetical protein